VQLIRLEAWSQTGQAGSRRISSSKSSILVLVYGVCHTYMQVMGYDQKAHGIFEKRDGPLALLLNKSCGVVKDKDVELDRS
jgi:hypothetical protein